MRRLTAVALLASVATLPAACASVLGLEDVSYSPPGLDAAAGTHWCETQGPAFACQDFDEHLSPETAPFLGFSTRSPGSMMQVAEAFFGFGNFRVDSDAGVASSGSALVSIREGDVYEGLKLAVLSYQAPQLGIVELEGKLKIEQGPVSGQIPPRPSVYLFSLGIAYGPKQTGSIGFGVKPLDLAGVSNAYLVSTAATGADPEIPIAKSIKRGDWVSVRLRYEEPGDGGMARIEAELDGVLVVTTARPGLVSGGVGLISGDDTAAEWLVRYDNLRLTGNERTGFDAGAADAPMDAAREAASVDATDPGEGGSATTDAGTGGGSGSG